MQTKEKIYQILKTKLFKGSASFLIMKLTAMAVGYINIWIISKFFGASALGIFSFVISVSTLLVVLSKTGTGIATVKFASKFLIKKQFSKLKHYYIQVIKIVSVPALLFSCILFFFNDFIADNIFHKPHYDFYFRLVSFILLPVTLTQINSQLNRAFKKIIKYAFLQFFTTFFTVLTMLIFLFFSETRDEKIPITLHVYSILIMTVISFIFSLSLIKWRKIKIIERISFKEITDVSFPMLNIAIAAAVLNWADKIILGFYVSDADIGIYHAMFRTSVFLTLFLMSANSVLSPKFSELWELNKMKEIQNLVRKATKMITLSTLPLFLLMIIFAKQISVLFGNEFEKGATILIILSVGQFVSVWAGPVGNFLLMSGHQKFNRNISLITTGIFIISSIIFVYIWDIVGAAVSISLVFIIRNMIYVIYVKKKFGINFMYIPGTKNKQ